MQTKIIQHSLAFLQSRRGQSVRFDAVVNYLRRKVFYGSLPTSKASIAKTLMSSELCVAELEILGCELQFIRESGGEWSYGGGQQYWPRGVRPVPIGPPPEVFQANMCKGLKVRLIEAARV